MWLVVFFFRVALFCVLSIRVEKQTKPPKNFPACILVFKFKTTAK